MAGRVGRCGLRQWMTGGQALVASGSGAVAIEASPQAAAESPATHVCSVSCVVVLQSQAPDGVGPATSAFSEVDP